MEANVKAVNNEDRQKLADKINRLAEEVEPENKALAHILWGVCGALLLKRERLFSRMMKGWVESRIKEVYKKKQKKINKKKRRQDEQ